jgi:hypothetical protein
MADAARLLSRVVLAVIPFMPCGNPLTLAGAEAPGPEGARKTGVNLYVSKLGDNSDGTSWAKAFHTIQAALNAIPDDNGGHRVIVRPDSYLEANLSSAHKGAPGAYNLLVGDGDGALGSGATGWVVIDSGEPGKGFKSYDWWSTIRAFQKGWSPQHVEPTFSAIVWDRWALRNLYVTGGDAGLFWDLTDKSGAGFTVVVEDCVGIGRAFGGGFGYPVAREKEPIVFRRCYLMCLDWWGDAGAVAVGAYNDSLPPHPDAVFEDCTIVGPDNAVQILNPSRYVRVKFRNCRLVVLNFSQPRGTPSTGIICCDVADPKYPQVDLEDCTLLGYKVFGTGGKPGQIAYTTRGKVGAYVQFEQPVPQGMERLGLWPVEVFDSVGPPPLGQGKPAAAPARRASLSAIPADPSSPGYAGRKGATLYVSKLGDNSDGSTWPKAFHTIQAALLAVPDEKGGHCVIVRPDTYVEANLYPAHQGAAGAYNLLAGDADGRLGSGATGWVVIDSSCPGVAVRLDPERRGAFKIVKSTLPESGLKCVDWWGPWRCDPYHSGVAWDRWVFRSLYCTGSEGGIGWDMTNQDGAEFSVTVEDCVGIGRFAGACVMAHVGRRDEPVAFRRCYFLNLDWWGDAGAAYVRAANKKMPDHPDAVFEDCTLVSPDNAFEVAYAAHGAYTRVRFQGCRMIVLNFSQPHGTPSSGILHAPAGHDGRLQVDLEDCTMMGYQVFGQGKVLYTIKGRVEAYVQYQQPVPEGFVRLTRWPVDLFQAIGPPGTPRTLHRALPAPGKPPMK